MSCSLSLEQICTCWVEELHLVVSNEPAWLLELPRRNWVESYDILDRLLAAVFRFEHGFGLLLVGIVQKYWLSSEKNFSLTAPAISIRFELVHRSNHQHRLANSRGNYHGAIFCKDVLNEVGNQWSKREELKASKRRSRSEVLTFYARTCHGQNIPTFGRL